MRIGRVPYKINAMHLLLILRLKEGCVTRINVADQEQRFFRSSSQSVANSLALVSRLAVCDRSTAWFRVNFVYGREERGVVFASLSTSYSCSLPEVFFLGCFINSKAFWRWRILVCALWIVVILTAVAVNSNIPCLRQNVRLADHRVTCA